MRQLYCLLFIFISYHAIGQNISFVADCNASEVIVGNAFRLSYRLENADIKNINFPDFETAGFRVLQGPISESNYSYINGVKSSSEAYIFILMAKETGNLRLNPAKVTTSKGQTFTSQAIKIKSIAAGANPSNNGNAGSNLPPSIDGKIIFRVEPSTTRAITGQQITLDFKIYTQVDLTSIEITQEPTLTNVYVHELRYYNQDAQIEVLNGVQYASKIIHSKAIFPSKEGELIIDPAVVAITIGRLSSTNSFAQKRNFSLNSAPVKINVTTLDKVPKSFTGAVGEYEFKAHVENRNITTDDAIKLTLRIVGKGDIKQILAPPVYFAKGTEGEPFDIYPPVLREEVREGKGFLGGIKEFHYTLNPQALGNFKLRPTFSYYDTKLKKMVTLDTLIDVEVVQGQRKLIKKDSLLDADAEENTAARLEFEGLQAKAYWQEPAKPVFGSLFFWIICLLPLLAFVGLWVGKAVIQRWLTLLAKQREKGRPEREAEQGMALAESFLKAGDTKALFETISTTLKNYLAARLQMSALDMEKETIYSKLKELAVDKEIIRQLDRIFKVSEETIFAGQDYQNSMQHSYDDAKEVLPKLFQLFK